MKTHKLNLIIIFIFTLSLYGYFIKPLDWNSASRLSLVKAIVEEKRLEIDTYQETEFKSGDVAYYNGHYYSDKAIGTSILGALVYFPISELFGLVPKELFIMVLTLLTISVPSALIAPLIYSFALRITNDKWSAFLIMLSISIGTPIFPYAGIFYGHTLAATLAFTIFYIWLRINQFRKPITYNLIRLSGFLIGFLILTEYTTVIIAIILVGYMAFITRKSQTFWNIKTILQFGLGGLIPFLLFASYNWICFGSPFSLGYANELLPGFKEVRGEGVMGIGVPDSKALLYMTIHPLVGIFTVSPILLVGLVGAIKMYKEPNWRTEFLVTMSILTLYFLAIAGVQDWWGGDAFTVRYLIPALPFFAIFMVFFNKKYNFITFCITSLSFFQMFVVSAIPYEFFGQYIRDTVQQSHIAPWNTSLFYNELLPRFLHNRLAFSWGGYFFDIKSWYFNSIILLTISSIMLYAFYITNKRHPSASSNI